MAAAADNKSSAVGFCCPPNSWGALKPAADYKPTGSVQVIAPASAATKSSKDLLGYVTGDQKSTKGILILPDIFGLNSGRTQAVADQFAAEGYLVVAVDYFRGAHYPESEMKDIMTKLPRWAWDFPLEITNKEIGLAVAFMQSKGVKSLGYIGFCYGCWAGFGMPAELQTKFSAGVDFHPSLALEAWVWSGNPGAMANHAQFPHLLLPAGNDPEFVRPGGAVIKNLQAVPKAAASEIIDFPDQQHGWVHRGDLSNATVVAGIQKALTAASQFLAKHVK